MSLSSSELKLVCEELEDVLRGGRVNRVVHFRKPRLLITVRKKGYNHNLVICLEAPFLRIHLTEARLEDAENRFPFGRQLGKTLAGFAVEEVRQLDDDRIAQFRFAKGGQTRFLLVELFRAKPNLYLLDENRTVIADWRREAAGKEYVPKPKASVRMEPQRFAVGQGEMFNFVVDREYRAAEEKAASEKEKAATIAFVQKEMRRTEMLLERLNREAEEAGKWQELNRRAELLKGNLCSIEERGARVRLTDWSTGEEVEIALDPSVTVQQNMERMFEQSKKLKRALTQIPNRILAAREKLSRLKGVIEYAEHPDDIRFFGALADGISYILSQCKEPFTKPARVPSVPFRVFTSREGFKIYVGKTASQNDRLVTSFARGRDLWFHARDFPGSHVVVRAKSRTEIGRETILDAATLALYYSKGKTDGAGDVIYTERKFIAKPKGLAPGAVNVSKHRVIRVELDEERIKSLKQRVPGSSDEATAD